MGIFDKLRRKQGKPASVATDDVKDAKKEVKEKAPAKAKKAEAKKEVVLTKHAHHVLLKPVFTEKSLISQTQDKVSFFVSLDANKHKVKMALQELYGINPVKVNIVNTKGKTIKQWKHKDGKRNDSKKAIVTVPKGTDISIFNR